MADGVSVSSIKPPNRPSKQNQPPPPPDFKSRFLFKALIAIFFFIVVPILPSIAPEFFDHNLFSQSWELLHIVFVGIAVSYGLFSRRYDDSGGEAPPKPDSTQSYVSRLLQASAVFDDDVDSPTASSSDDGESKVQAWSSQYFRNEPVLVVANKKQSSVIRDEDHKPLLLPVRSLKSRVSDENGGGESSRVSGRPYARSRSYSSNSAQKEPNSNSNWEKKLRNGSLKSRVSDFNGFSPDGAQSPRVSTETVNEEENVVLPSPIPWRSRSGRLEKKEEDPPMEEIDPNSNPNANPSMWSSKASPVKAFPAPACLFESQSNRSEDFGRKKIVYRSLPPPPPPLPPPRPPVALYNKPPLSKSRTVMADPGNEASSWERAEERSKAEYSSSMRSRRTIRSTRSWKEAAEEEQEEEEEPVVTRKPDELTHEENPFSDYANEVEHDFLGEIHAMSDDDDYEEEEDNTRREMEKPENGKELESDVAGACSSSNGVDDEGPDVDKKADEFIAKFREQIRLQRIESIKRSTGQLSRSSVQ